MLVLTPARGQTSKRARYYAQGSRYGFYLTRDEIVLSFARRTRGLALALRFVGANPNVVLQGRERAPGYVNYLRGRDSSNWRTRLPRHAQVVYRELWPGIDLVLRGEAGKLKYEFRVRPGARIGDIRLAYRGANRLALNDAGALQIGTALGVLRDSAPVSYQEVAGRRVPVQSRYVLRGKRSYGFSVGAGYERGRELIIDPGLDYSTFLGGTSHEMGAAIAVDASGNAYVTGFTQSPNFPTTSGASTEPGRRATTWTPSSASSTRLGRRSSTQRSSAAATPKKDALLHSTPLATCTWPGRPGPRASRRPAARSTGPSMSTTARAAASTSRTDSSPS